VYAAGRLSSEEDFITLFPSYEDTVKGWGLDIAQAQLEQDFQVNLVKGELADLFYEGYQMVRDEYIAAGRGALRGNRQTFALIGRRAGLTARQTGLITDIAMVASHLDGMRATTANLAKIAEQIRQNPEIFE